MLEKRRKAAARVVALVCGYGTSVVTSSGIDRGKLGKVLALLTSPMDGEVLAAARMTVKLLADAGLRPEDLAKSALVISARPPPRSVWTPSEPWSVKPKPYDPTPRRCSFADLKPKAARQVLAYMLVCGRLPLKDAAFVREIAERMYERPHEELYSDEKARLTRLWNKVAPEKAA
jgi:hypothetical protein